MIAYLPGVTTPPALHALLAGAIDFAGVFPPASLALREAAEVYARERHGPEAWALGRFVLPVGRLEELGAAVGDLGAGDDPWSLAVVGGSRPGQDLAVLARFAKTPAAAAVQPSCFEWRVAGPDDLVPVAAQAPDDLELYAELPLDGDWRSCVSLLRATGIGAKFRTGGVIADAFPDPEVLLEAMATVLDAGVRFKCTAGLHHAVRGRYRLTSAPDSPEAQMYGYLNLFLAAAALMAGAGRRVAGRILGEDDPAAFAVAGDGLSWRDCRFDRKTLRALRTGGLRAFGSCSFREPLDELAVIAA
jgi:hypothetical protein